MRQTVGAATDRFVHGPAGLHSQRDSAGGWEWSLMDGLGSLRAVAGSADAVLETRTYDPYGQPLASAGTPQTPFGFTGELTDASGLLYLRARTYAPRLGAFTALDPYEGSAARPMSLNGYSWVEGNVANAVDPSGRCSLNSGSTYSQRTQCSDAINQYIRLIEQQYDPQMNWSPDLRARSA